MSDILIAAKEQRINEVAGYQINITNYTMAIEHITALNDQDLFPFRDQLADLLKSELLEQKKTQVMLSVIQKQLEALNVL